MIVVTGAAGFIASNLAGRLNDEGLDRLVLVDDFSKASKLKNLEHKRYLMQVHRDDFFGWMDKNHPEVEFVFHLGARTDTSEFDTSVFDRLNLDYTKKIWSACTAFSIPLVYASSAATYGAGELGYDDDHCLIPRLKPLNPYGESKNEFDKWALLQSASPPVWAGLKFFNVYGPNEYHKERMASVVFHAFRQIRDTGRMKLFRSHRAGIGNGLQMRDFIYVKDVVNVIWFFYKNRPPSGIYNLGTGKARTFLDLALATFSAMNIPPFIEYIDTPSDIRDTYQYFTEARMEKLAAAGYGRQFTSLEEGIRDYVSRYLMSTDYC